MRYFIFRSIIFLKAFLEPIKRVAVQNTQFGQRYILADSEKFGFVSSVTFADFDGTVTLTDRQPDESFYKKMEIRVV